MAITDGQIALGVLQLVALSLPIFAVLAQLYFSMVDDNKNISVGLFILLGGIFLITGAVLSAHHLFTESGSITVEMSLLAISIGLILILPLLYSVYERTRNELKKNNQNNLQYINKMIYDGRTRFSDS